MRLWWVVREVDVILPMISLVSKLIFKAAYLFLLHQKGPFSTEIFLYLM